MIRTFRCHIAGASPEPFDLLAKSFGFSRARECAAGLRTGVLSIFEDLHAIDKNVFHAGRVLVRLFEGGVIGNCRRIEDNNVSKHSLLEQPAMIEAEIDGRQSA